VIAALGSTPDIRSNRYHVSVDTVSGHAWASSRSFLWGDYSLEVLVLPSPTGSLVQVNAKIKLMGRNFLRDEVNAVLAAISRLDATRPEDRVERVNDVSHSDDIATELRRLADLHQQGLLTKEEFVAAKAHVLGVRDT
jgi:Short C-terminal domain